MSFKNVSLFIIHSFLKDRREEGEKRRKGETKGKRRKKKRKGQRKGKKDRITHIQLNLIYFTEYLDMKSSSVFINEKCEMITLFPR